MKKICLLSSITLLSSVSGCSQEQKPIAQEQGAQKTMAKTTDSGLRYEIIEEAPEGAKEAQEGTVVKVHYTGWLDEEGKKGAKFDSSVDRGQPFQFALGAGQVIKGWDEGVCGMKIGEKRCLIIPAELGYGAHGAGGVIPPNATLIFDVELLDA